MCFSQGTVSFNMITSLVESEKDDHIWTESCVHYVIRGNQEIVIPRSTLSCQSEAVDDLHRSCLRPGTGLLTSLEERDGLTSDRANQDHHSYSVWESGLGTLLIRYSTFQPVNDRMFTLCVTIYFSSVFRLFVWAPRGNISDFITYKHKSSYSCSDKQNNDIYGNTYGILSLLVSPLFPCYHLVGYNPSANIPFLLNSDPFQSDSLHFKKGQLGAPKQKSVGERKEVSSRGEERGKKYSAPPYFLHMLVFLQASSSLTLYLAIKQNNLNYGFTY